MRTAPAPILWPGVNAPHHIPAVDIEWLFLVDDPDPREPSDEEEEDDAC